MKRTPLRRRSKKRAKQDRDNAPAEAEYRMMFPTCQLCQVRPSAELHHLAGGTSGRRLSKGKRACLLMLCKPCHDECTASKHSPEFQAARKLFSDPNGFDLAILNSCRVRKLDASDVLLEVLALLAG